jgi:hypothetical protein
MLFVRECRGIFGPSLFVGAKMCGAVGAVAHSLFPGSTASPGAYALVGMGTVFAGIVRTPLTSVIMIFEMTRDYSIIVPLMISNMIGFSSHRRFSRSQSMRRSRTRKGFTCQLTESGAARPGSTRPTSWLCAGFWSELAHDLWPSFIPILVPLRDSTGVSVRIRSNCEAAVILSGDEAPRRSSNNESHGCNSCIAIPVHVPTCRFHRRGRQVWLFRKMGTSAGRLG